MRWASIAALCLVLTACDSTSTGADAAPGTDAARVDSSAPGTDGSVVRDAARPTSDAGPAPMPADCVAPEVLCVDDTPGPTQEFSSIQDAVDVAGPGDSVVVFDGSYAGFRLDTDGTASEPITVRAVGRVDLVSTAPSSDNVIRIQNTSYVTVDGFHIDCGGTTQPYDYDYSGMAARGALATEPMRGIVVRNMEITGCSPAGFYCSQCQGLVLTDNYIHDNVREAEGGNGMGIYLSNAGTDDVTAIGNRFEDNEGPGIHLNGDSSIGGDGVQTGHLFERNTFIGNGQNGLNMDGVQSVTFINNVIADNRNHGIRGFQIDGAEGPANFVVINNTFVSNGGNPVKLTADGGGHVLFNNLMVDNVEGGLHIMETTPQTSSNLLEASATGVLLDAPGRDFRLAPGSSAIGAGAASFGGQSAPAADMDGNPRGDPPDVGAFEAP